MLMLLRRFAVVFGLFVGTLASQLPEYAQQYRQRLGGALDELTRELAEFDGEASTQGLDRQAAIQRLEDNPDTLARQRGDAVQRTAIRRDRLADQDQAFDRAGAFGRLVLLARDFDPAVARGAWNRFEPALPVTSEGLVAGALGLLLGYGVWHAGATPFRRRLRRSGPRTNA